MGHLWRDKWIALSGPTALRGPLSQDDEEEEEDEDEDEEDEGGPAKAREVREPPP